VTVLILFYCGRPMTGTPTREVGMKRITLCLCMALACSMALPSGADAFRKKETARAGYTLALFPVKVIAHWGEGYAALTEAQAVEGVAGMAADDSLLELKYAYRRIEASDDTLVFNPATGNENVDVWRQTSLLANYSPNWQQVKSIGTGIAADLAILIRIRQDEDSLVAVYLYDFRTAKTYAQISRGVYYGSMAAGVQKISEALMQYFYDDQ